MSFSKSFPRTEGKSGYPIWEEVPLSDEEEKNIEQNARQVNIALLKECVEDARKIIYDENMRDYQTDISRMAVALFEKRASHVVFWKEQVCKDKFDSKFKNSSE